MASSFIIGGLVKRLVAAFKAEGITITVTSGLRSTERQQELWTGRNANDYPVAMPGNSQHEYGVAVDMIATPSEYHPVLVDVWQRLGFYWDSSDYVHFPVFDPYTWARLLEVIKPKLPAEQPPTYQKKTPKNKVNVGMQYGFNLTSLGYPQESPFVLPYEQFGFDVPNYYVGYKQEGIDWLYSALNPKTELGGIGKTPLSSTPWAPTTEQTQPYVPTLTEEPSQPVASPVELSPPPEPSPQYASPPSEEFPSLIERILEKVGGRTRDTQM